MRKNGKRIVGVVCALAMLAAMMPPTALAADPLTSSTTVLTDQLPAEADDLDPAGTAASGTESGSTAADSGTETADTTGTSTESTGEGNTPAADGVEQPTDAETPADVPAEEQPTAGPSAPAVPDNSLSAPVTANGDTAPGIAPGIAPLLENAVAKIGDTEYPTLDAAVEAAQDGATIELLADASTDGLNLTKDLTIQAAAGLSEKPTLTFVKNGIALWGKSLTFKDLNVVMNGIGSTPYTAEWSWMTICASKDASLTLNNTTMTMDATGVTNSPHAIYFCSNNKLNVENGSVLTIKNYPQDALEWDGGDGGYNVNITDSTFVSDHNRSGFTGTFYATITNSRVDVINSSGNGSNGSNFAIDASEVMFANNGTHGISATDLTIENGSNVVSDNNGYYGVYANGDFLVDSTSTLTVTNNSARGDFAGLKLTSGVKNGKVEAGAVVTITGNYCSGLSNNGKCVFDEGSKLTITNNNNDKGTSSHGGGIYNSGSAANLTLPSDAVIYNNHSKTDGDDIFNNSTSTITFPAVNGSWILDDCEDAIDGWYYDNADSRWNVHDKDLYSATLFTDLNNGMATVASQKLCLKAAHAETATLQPADITIYMGGEGGYDGVVDEDGTIVQNNSLPEPGYYITLSDEVNAALQAAGLVDADNTPVNLSDLITVRTVGAQGEHVWHLQKYGNTYSAARGKYIYAIVPEEGTDPFRLTFRDGETLLDEDSFVLSEEKNLQAQYGMDVYSELVDARQVFLKVTIPGQEPYYCNVYTAPGKLNVRYVTGSQDSVVTPAYTDIAQASQADNPDNPDKTALDKAYVIRDPYTKFYINKSRVDVTEGNEFARVSLLFDDIVSSANTEGVEDYKQLLTDKAVQAAASGLVNVQSQAKYLDLVDANNGNVWLTTDDPVTVYWPYPEGTDASTDFRLVHFEGLDRDMPTDKVIDDIAGTAATVMPISKDEYGISFTTSRFSPYVLVWGDTPAVQNPSNESGTPASTPAPTATPAPAATPAPTAAPAVIPQTGDSLPLAPLMGVAALAVVAFVALLIGKKRRDR